MTPSRSRAIYLRTCTEYQLTSVDLEIQDTTQSPTWFYEYHVKLDIDTPIR
jgi:hypothetical protein